MPIKVEIVSQDRMVFVGSADIVLLPGEAGEMGILPNHAPLLTTLKFGVITIREKGIEDRFFTVAGGFAEVQPDQVTVMADAAENVEEIDEERAERARKQAEEGLKLGVKGTDEYSNLRLALLKSTLRLRATTRYKKGKQLQG